MEKYFPDNPRQDASLRQLASESSLAGDANKPNFVEHGQDTPDQFVKAPPSSEQHPRMPPKRSSRAAAGAKRPSLPATPAESPAARRQKTTAAAAAPAEETTTIEVPGSRQDWLAPLHEMYGKHELTDVVLIVGDRSLFAHKVVLRAQALTQGVPQAVPGVPQDPFAPHRGPLRPFPEYLESAIGNTPALVPGPLARL